MGSILRTPGLGILDAGIKPNVDLETHEDGKEDLFVTQSGLESQKQINVKAFPKRKRFAYDRQCGDVPLS